MSSSSLTLYATRADFGLPDTSSFVIKTEVQLKMAGVTYDRASAIPPQAPNGKLPFINDHDEVVSDSTFIRAHIERKYGADLDAGLDVRQRAESWTIERLLEEYLYFAMVWSRWIDPLGPKRKAVQCTAFLPAMTSKLNYRRAPLLRALS